MGFCEGNCGDDDDADDDYTYDGHDAGAYDAYVKITVMATNSRQ
jgi:hypothetical protein